MTRSMIVLLVVCGTVVSGGLLSAAAGAPGADVFAAVAVVLAWFALAVAVAWAIARLEGWLNSGGDDR